MVQVAVSSASSGSSPGGGSTRKTRRGGGATTGGGCYILKWTTCMILLCILYVRWNNLLFGGNYNNAPQTQIQTQQQQQSSSKKTKKKRGKKTTGSTNTVTIPSTKTLRGDIIDNNISMGVASASTSSFDSHSSSSSVIGLHPEEIVINDVLIHYQMPPSDTSTTSTNINGIVLLFHGCNRRGIDWFQLPEEQTIVRYLLSQSNIVIAISSYGAYKTRGSTCWDNTYPPSDNHDVQLISSVLLPESSSSLSSSSSHSSASEQFFEKLNKRINPTISSIEAAKFTVFPSMKTGVNDDDLRRRRQTTTKVPIYGIGASSGGTFVTILNQVLPMNGMELIVSPGHRVAIDWMSIQKYSSTTSSGTSIVPPPRIAFVYMPKDQRFATDESISKHQDILAYGDNGIKSIKFTCHPKPITSEWLHTRIEHLTLQQSQAIVDILIETNSIDSSTGYLLVNPRRQWKKIYTKMQQHPVLLNDSGVVQNSILLESIEECFNLAEAMHELTSEYITDVYEFWTK